LIARLTFGLGLALIAAGVGLGVATDRASAQPGWTIESFDVTYDIEASGVVSVTEDIRVDFGFLQRHGIFRDMPVRYEYDDDNDRMISVGDVRVDNGAGEPHEFELISSGANLRIKIGDADAFVTGEQRYRITYTLLSALNPIVDAGTGDEWDEFYWNVTGNDWEAPIESASATVNLPSDSIREATCFEGPSGSTDPCDFDVTGQAATFSARQFLPTGSGLTIAVKVTKDAIDVGPPILVPAEKDFLEQLQDAFKFTPLTIGASVFVGLIGLLGLARLWWEEGRDRWHGDLFYLMEDDGASPGARKPLMAHEAIVTDFEPPEVMPGRRMRPAEIGVLVDEKADTLEVTATIIDLAVRKHLTIAETKSGGFLGLFKKTDYELTRLTTDEAGLVSFEKRTLLGIFGHSKTTVKLSDLRAKFYKHLDKIKESLYVQAVQDKFFPRSPDSVRTIFRVAGLVVAVVGGAIGFGLGVAFGGALIGVPLVIIGLLMFILAGSMPRRTARGRALYRRSLGFKKFMVTAETERQKFAERANIFHEYLPYAIIFECVERWTKVFADLGMLDNDPYWYTGTAPMRWAYFTHSMTSFTNSVSSTIASTPGGSGGSGFGGGGSSGGGGGGGGGGSW